jgi:hypothetical protein
MKGVSISKTMITVGFTDGREARLVICENAFELVVLLRNGERHTEGTSFRCLMAEERRERTGPIAEGGERRGMEMEMEMVD